MSTNETTGRLEGPCLGSVWITCNQSGKAACPHCEKLSWVTPSQVAPQAVGSWGGACSHVVGPGLDEYKKVAVIFKGTA